MRYIYIYTHTYIRTGGGHANLEQLSLELPEVSPAALAVPFPEAPKKTK